MQIVIDIHEKDYRSALNGVLTYSAIYSFTHGTVLPENHGRLIDAKAYEQDICKHYFDNESVIRCTEIALSNAPTIIEADTESEVRDETDN